MRRFSRLARGHHNISEGDEGTFDETIPAVGYNIFEGDEGSFDETIRGW